jgi:DNA polymerase III subunit delta'
MSYAVNPKTINCEVNPLFMVFSKIKGHVEALSRISKEIHNRNFEGVFLFNGPVAVGKYTVARAIGRYLTCDGLKDDTCRCENCRLFPNVPDYLELYKGAAGMITVGDIEPIDDFLSLVAYRGRYRVIVIDNAHNMNNASASRLLKTMEEIPKNCVIILVSDSPDKIPQPVLSRCYQFDFSALSSEDTKDILRGLGHDTSQIGDISRMIPYLSESVLANFNRYSEYVRYIPSFLKDISTMSEDDIIAVVKDIDHKEDIQVFMDVLLVFINDIFKIRYDSPDVVCNVKKIDYLEGLTDVWKDDICMFMIDRIRKAQEDIRKKINLKPGQLFLPSIMWLYYFLHKTAK